MRTSLLNRFAGIFLALTVTAGSAVSSNIFDGKDRNRAADTTCINQISGLSQEQKDKITTMITEHQSAMNELREKRRSTTDVTKKDQIRKQMDTQVESHRKAVKALLTDDQQKQFDQLPRNVGNQNFQGQRQGAGKGYGRGYGPGNGRGYGRCNGTGKGSAFVDNNKNGICDTYESRTVNMSIRKGKGNGFGNGQGQGKGRGRNFVDENKNGVCDTFEKIKTK